MFRQIWVVFLDHLPEFLVGLAIFLVFAIVGVQVSRMIRGRLTRKIYDPLVIPFISKLIKAVFIIIGLMICLQLVGFTGLAGGVLAGAGISAFIVGFAFKDIGENFLAGIILAFNRPFRVNDTIQIGDHVGKVLALNVRSTRIKTFDGKDIYIPNGMLIKSVLTNYTQDGLNRHEFLFGISMDSDLEKASAAVLDCIKKVDGVVNEMPPFIVLDDIKTDIINIRVIFWIYTYDYKRGYLTIKSDV
jgi:small-conductance mechanosensitive channel